MTRTQIAAWLFGCAMATVANAQSQIPYVYSAVNAASYGRSGIAQGSLFVVFGSTIGPAQIERASTLPLPMQVGGTSITVSSGAFTVSCPMIYALAGQVAAILPSSVPTGSANLSLTYNGIQSPFSLPVTVVASAVGLFTVGSSGFGPGVFTGVDNTVNTFTATAKPGDILTAWATGLGPVAGAEGALPSTFPSFPGVQVFVGTEAAKILYAGRSGCCVAVDQISFEVPQGVSGCYLPVAVSLGGKISNFVTVAVNSAAETCSDAAPTMPTGVLTRAVSGQPVNAAVIAIGPVSVLRGLGFDPRRSVAEKLTQLLRVKVSDSDANGYCPRTA